ncbi:Headcase protein [Melipona quadrifasciata]|uniref:Headcase protein n=1 Tax=Melipona quadrifasciata TaxID=166423 RepID=A0A0N1IU56_9HYME|nr:Headcase protein [Melipona quadrifasciata]
MSSLQLSARSDARLVLCRGKKLPVRFLMDENCAKFCPKEIRRIGRRRFLSVRLAKDPHKEEEPKSEEKEENWSAAWRCEQLRKHEQEKKVKRGLGWRGGGVIACQGWRGDDKEALGKVYIVQTCSNREEFSGSWRVRVKFATLFAESGEAGGSRRRKAINKISSGSAGKASYSGSGALKLVAKAGSTRLHVPGVCRNLRRSETTIKYGVSCGVLSSREYKIPIDLPLPRKYLKSIFAFHAKAATKNVQDKNSLSLQQLNTPDVCVVPVASSMVTHMEDEGNHGNDDTRCFILSTLAALQWSRVSCVLCRAPMLVFDRYPLVDGTFFLSPRQHSTACAEVKVEGRTQFLSAVCMSCLEGSGGQPVRCRYCTQPWDGSSLVLGTMYSYDIFAAMPCCTERLKCNSCQKPLIYPHQRLNFYSDYSRVFACPHCRAVDAHFVKPLSVCFTREQFQLYSQWP